MAANLNKHKISYNALCLNGVVAETDLQNNLWALIETCFKIC